VSTFALIHGGGSSAWDWHLVAPELEERGHEPIAVDLPTEDPSAGWWEYADAVVEAVGDREHLVVVAHSMGGFTAPLVCARRPADLLVFVAGMIPVHGETFSDFWTNTGYEDSGHDEHELYFHDVPPELEAESKRRERSQADKPFAEPWPLEHWPDVPTRYLLCRDDRLFSPEWARRHARERLGIEADEMDGGHYIALARPTELAERLAGYASL
jgi:pimeloyl-ACP methyl ester carboxylesterase